MSDQATSGEPSAAPATAAGSAPSATPTGDIRPIGSFGNARGSGLARGKRATPAPAAPASSAGVSSYKPSSLAVITSKSEYVNPFTGETTVSAPVNEPAPQAAPPPSVSSENASTPVANDIPSIERAAPVQSAPAREMFPFTPPAGNEPKPGSPQPQPEPQFQRTDSSINASAKAEIKILPPTDVKRPSVSWGDGTQDEDTRPQRDQRPTFQPERRDPKKFEPREPRAFEPREPKAFEPREPRREPALEQRGPLPRNDRNTPRAEPVRRSNRFFTWLKGLFGGKPAAPVPSQPTNRDGQNREGDYGQRRHRGGRGRGGYQGDNRNARDSQPRDPRDEPHGGGPSYQRGEQQGQGDGRYEGGGGGRRRRRGGRGRNRDDRGGPRSEGQQGGGAI